MERIRLKEEVSLISNELKEWIIPNLKMNLDEADWKYIDDMFTECYVTLENGLEVVALKPPASYNPSEGQMKLCMQFSKLNGSFYGVDDWEYVRNTGKPI